MVQPLNQGSQGNKRWMMMTAAAALSWTMAYSPAAGQVIVDQLDDGVIEEEWLEEPVEIPSPNTGKLSFSAGSDFTHAYFFRGIIQEDQGFIAQPWAELSIDFCDCQGTVSDFYLTLGIWNSLHSKGTSAGRETKDLEIWFESDLYAVLGMTLLDNWDIDFTYVAYTSPSDAFATIHEISFGATYNDSEFWKKRNVSTPGFNGLQPSVRLAYELDNTVFGSAKGIYLELGIAPSFTSVFELGGDPITMTWPMTVGISLDDYYEETDAAGGDNETFGYFDIGVDATWPMNFIPPDYGSWKFTGRVHVLYMGQNLEEANSGDDLEIIASVGIGLDY